METPQWGNGGKWEQVIFKSGNLNVFTFLSYFKNYINRILFMEPDTAGIYNPDKIKTWADIKSLRLNWLSHPGAPGIPILYIFSLKDSFRRVWLHLQCKNL